MLNGVQLLELISAPETGQLTPGPQEEAARPARHRTALVIEDSDLTRSMIATTLEEAGWRVLEAVDGQVGLELFGAQETDLVITDLDMPRLDGLGAVDGMPKSARELGAVEHIVTLDDLPAFVRALGAPA